MLDFKVKFFWLGDAGIFHGKFTLMADQSETFFEASFSVF
jgi:hypothetical protein